MVLGTLLIIREVCMDIEPCFKVFNLVYVHPKSIKLGQMTTTLKFQPRSQGFSFIKGKALRTRLLNVVYGLVKI